MKIKRRTLPEVVRLWVKKLRSGEYEQGTQRLHIDYNGRNSFCCLGVLTDLCMKDGFHLNWESPVLPEDDPYISSQDQEQGRSTLAECGYLPVEIAKFMDLTYLEQEEFITMNDDHGRPFSYIADKITEFYKQRGVI